MLTWVKAIGELTDLENKIRASLRDTDAETLTVKQLHVLYALYQNDRQQVSKLAHFVNMLPTSFTPTIDQLERGGYIERTASPEDRRVVIVCLRDKGKRLRALIVGAINAA